MQYLIKVIIPIMQYLKGTIPKTQDSEPAALWSQNLAGRIVVLLL